MSLERELLNIIGNPDRTWWGKFDDEFEQHNAKKFLEIIDDNIENMWKSLYDELEKLTENKHYGDISPYYVTRSDHLKVMMLHLFLAVAEDNVIEEKKKKYTVRWTQTLQEDFEVEANSEEEAIEMVRNGECGDVDNIADNDFEIIETKEA